jgi:hypothetical protein
MAHLMPLEDLSLVFRSWWEMVVVPDFRFANAEEAPLICYYLYRGQSSALPVGNDLSNINLALRFGLCFLAI